MIEDGRGFRFDLESVVHGTVEAKDVDNRALKRWLRECQHAERKVGFLMIRHGIDSPKTLATLAVAAELRRPGSTLAIAAKLRRDAQHREGAPAEAVPHRPAPAVPPADGPDPTKKAQCPECGKLFGTIAGRDSHVAAKHRREPTTTTTTASRRPDRTERGATHSSERKATVVVDASDLEFYEVAAWRERLAQLIASGVRNAIIDFTTLNYVSGRNVGVGALITATSDTLRSVGGSVAIVASDEMLQVFEITQLDQHWPIYPTRIEAISAVEDDSA
jgi:anti-sigma B factor antagonist